MDAKFIFCFIFNNTDHKNKGIDNSIYTEKALKTLLRKKCRKRRME